MNLALLFLISLALFSSSVSQFQAHAASLGPLTKHLSSLVKWTRASSKTPHQPDGNVLQFEDGYLVETVVEGNELGVIPYSIRVSQDGELFAVDSVNSNIVRITPPLSQYSRARLVAGSFKGQTGHVDGKPTDARFNHPKGVTMDDKGNIYVADTANLAIRKIGEAGVTTIAGGKSNVVGYRDGPSEDAKFSSDFDVIYVRPTCSLLVIDRGNAALRQISLNKDDCGYENQSITATDILMVAGAILAGYALCKFQQGFGSSFFSNTKGHVGTKLEQSETSSKIPTPIDATVKNENEAGWPSFEQLIWDLSKLVLESLGGIFARFIPSRFKGNGSKQGLAPLKDSLIMPKDEAELSSTRKQGTPTPLSETRQTRAPTPVETFSDAKPPKHRSKDPSLSSKHRSSRRQEYAEFYGSSEVPQYPQVRSKSQKERTKHRSREKKEDATFGAPVMDSKPVESKDTKYDPYNFRSKYGESYRF
ncbi:hypothetical protein CDL12_11402 [Handroanthus impetiginosus]|uniref:Peptidylamidoglycolate lyase n=1 Tax=Handroanthus impetiginosus TaxID=429701 RepID=A0A2G9HEI8_9LAMI|nr:hypothetical protein CDL12_11402 [Handroanthus impetiginosus]